MIIVPGGFGRSTYLVDRLNLAYNPASPVPGQRIIKVFDGMRNRDWNEPVAVGALLRYCDISERGIPVGYAFGVALVEPWNPHHHPDATKTVEVEDIDGTKLEEDAPEYAVVMTDPVDQSDVVLDRWSSIVKKVSGPKLSGGPMGIEADQTRAPCPVPIGISCSTAGR